MKTVVYSLFIISVGVAYWWIMRESDQIDKEKKEADEKAAEDLKKVNREALIKGEVDLQLQKEQGLLDEASYQQSLCDIRVKFANSIEEATKAKIALIHFENEEYKKKLARDQGGVSNL